MKKIFTLSTAILFAFSLHAQTRQAGQFPGMHELPNHQPVVKSDNSRVLGDTVFFFDGNFFSGNGISQSTFNFANDDIDGLQVATQLNTEFGPASSFKFFFELLPTPGDTNVYISATSWFNPVAQADNWFSMGPVSIPANGAVLSWGHNMVDGAFRDGYKVKVSTTGLANYADFTSPPIFSVNDNDPSTTGDTVNSPNNVFATRMVDLSAFAGQDIFIAFHHTANDKFILSLDNILVTEGPTSVPEISKDEISLFQNQPNPVRNFTNIIYSLKKSYDVSFEVYDITGQTVRALNEGNQAAGKHNVLLDTRGLNGGIYFYTLKTSQYSLKRKMVVIK